MHLVINFLREFVLNNLSIFHVVQKCSDLGVNLASSTL